MSAIFPPAGRGRDVARRAPMRLLDHLRADHDTLRELLAEPLMTPSRSAQTRAAFDHVQTFLLRHAQAEERALYGPAVDLRVTSLLAQASMHGHRTIAAHLSALQASAPALGTPAWCRAYAAFCRCVEQHLDEEEARLFPVVARTLPGREQVLLAERYRADMARGERVVTASVRDAQLRE